MLRNCLLLLALSSALPGCGSKKGTQQVPNNWDAIEGYSESVQARVAKLESCKASDRAVANPASSGEYVDIWGAGAKACRETFADSDLSKAQSALWEFEEDSVLGTLAPLPPTISRCAEGAAMVQFNGENSETCSPWKDLDRDRSWDLIDWSYFKRLSFLTKMEAWNAVREGNHERGLTLLRNCISFGHHLARGGVTGIQMALANAVSSSCAVSVRALLNSPHFRVSNWEDWAEELGNVANAQPEPASTFLAERKRMVRGLSLTSATEEEILSTRAIKKALDEVFISSVLGCESDWLSCYSFLENEKAQVETSNEELRTRLGGETSKTAIAGLNLSEKESIEATALTVKSMHHIGGRMMTAPIDLRRDLSYIQLHLLFRAMAEKSRACPELEAFASPELQALLRDPASTGMIAIAASEKGYELRPQMTVEPGPEGDTVEPWLLSCESHPWEPSDSSIAIAEAVEPSAPGIEEEELEESAPARSKETESLIAEIRAGIRTGANDEKILSAKSLALLWDNPQALEVRAVPSIKEGKANGFKLYGFGPDSLLNTLGFKVGDTVVSVNGKHIAEGDNMQAVLDSIKNKTETSYPVEILRGGKASALLFRLE